MNHNQPTTDDSFISQLIENPIKTIALYYASVLAAHPKAIAFVLDTLGLTAQQAGQQQIGFSDRSLGKRIPNRQIKQGRKIREQLIGIGLFKPNGRETLRGYVTVPIRDQDGEIVGIQGHKLGRHTAGPETILLGQEEKESIQEPDIQEQANEIPENTKTPETTTDQLVIEDDQILFVRDDRRYRIRGIEKNASICQLKVNLMVSRDQLVHLDTLDLVKARSRTSFIKAAATELYTDADTIKKDIGTLLLKLETYQSDRIAAIKQPKKVEVELTQHEQEEALELLRSPSLLERIVADIDACGMVGESTNKLAGYLAATSRKLDSPLAIVIQSSSSAGKTSLMDAVLSMMPGEDVNRFSGMTGQSLFYLDSHQIRNKTLAISEDEGIAEATYALKLLQSEGKLRHATVGRGENGRAQTQDHEVEGPVQIFLTTTAMDIDEELVNRCLVLTVDESRDQTGAIQAIQRDARTQAAFNTAQNAKRLRALHQNAQRLIKPMKVFNPFAPQLTFASDKTRLRRDHQKYLTLIETIALLHQHQRQVHQGTDGDETFDYLNVERNDIAIANGLAGEVLGRSLDELAPQTRNLLGKLNDFVTGGAKTTGVHRNAFRFTRRDIREATKWSNTQLAIHLGRLVEMEYLIVHRGKNGQRYVYELLYAGEGIEGQPFLMGLIDPAKLTEPASTAKTFPDSQQPSGAQNAPSGQLPNGFRQPIGMVTEQ